MPDERTWEVRMIDDKPCIVLHNPFTQLMGPEDITLEMRSIGGNWNALLPKTLDDAEALSDLLD